MLCGLKANQLVSHVTRKHKMKTEDYYIAFPGAKLSQLTDAQKQKMIETKRAKETKNKQNKRAMQERRNEVANQEQLRCEICGFESALSLISHITRKHSMLMSDYRQRYPNASVQRSAPSQSKSLSDVLKKKLEDENERLQFMEWRSFPSEVKHWTRKGFSEEEALQKIADFQRTQSLKGNNDETRELRSKLYSGENNPMSLQSLSKKNGVSVSEAIKLTPCYGRLGSLHPMFGKKHTPEAIKKIGNHLNFGQKSKIEHEMSDRIISFYGGNKNDYVDGWCCDYVNHEKKIIVEFFGDFWHHNPRKYSKDWINPFTKRTSPQAWSRDERKISDLKNRGFKVIVVWERDWRLDRENQLQRIKDAFDSV